MEITGAMVYIGKKDIEHLTDASTALAELAATIQASRPAYMPSAVGTLSRVNDLILSVRGRALSIIAKRLAASDDQADQEARERQAAVDSEPGVRRRKRLRAKHDQSTGGE